jgi:hypothetical protein
VTLVTLVQRQFGAADRGERGEIAGAVAEVANACRLNHETHCDYNRTDNHSSENKRSFNLIVHRSLSLLV